VDVVGGQHAKLSLRTGAIDSRVHAHNSGWWGAPAGMILGTRTAHAVSLGTNAASRLTIDAAGNVGIGTVAPQNRLDVEGALSASNLFGGGAFRLAAGRTPAGSTNWQPYSGTAGIFVDVDTTSAGFTATPVYLTALHGSSNHWTTTGGTSVYTPTQTGFRIYVRWADGSALTPAQANANGWHIQWLGIQLPAQVVIGPVTPAPVILDPGVLKIKG